MSDDYFSALADNATKVVKETKNSTNSILKNNSGCLPKIFTIAFVAILLYMGFNFARISPTGPKDTVTVGGAFYGNIQPDKNGNINIPLGNKNNLSPTIDVSKKDTNANPDNNDDVKKEEPEPDKNQDPDKDQKPDQKPEKPSSTIKPTNIAYVKISDRLKVGMPYTEVLGWLGLPTKKLEVLNESKQISGFTMCIWDVANKRVMITFYKNKLHSISYQ